jgi:hypothetical protein
MRGATELKPEENWSKKEDELALADNKALNALFSGVDKYIFRLIKQCTVAKDAWCHIPIFDLRSHFISFFFGPK